MFQENELVTFLLGCGTLVFILAMRRTLSRLPSWGWMLAAYLALLAGWVATVLEGVLLGDVLDGVEHVCYAASAVLLAFWAARVFVRPRGEAD